VGYWPLSEECFMSMDDAINTKPHHFIDIVGEYGAGARTFKPHPYGHAVHVVAERVWADPDVTLVMELGADAICDPCIHNVDGLCDDTIDVSNRPKAPTSKREYNLLLDRRWCQTLGLEQGDRLTAREFCRRLLDLPGDFGAIYAEEPADDTAARERDVRRGSALLLGRQGRSAS
jgi:hypothetical protein